MGFVPARRPGWLLEGRSDPPPRGMAAHPPALFELWRRTEPGLQTLWHFFSPPGRRRPQLDREPQAECEDRGSGRPYGELVQRKLGRREPPEQVKGADDRGAGRALDREAPPGCCPCGPHPLLGQDGALDPADERLVGRALRRGEQDGDLLVIVHFRPPVVGRARPAPVPGWISGCRAGFP